MKSALVEERVPSGGVRGRGMVCLRDDIGGGGRSDTMTHADCWRLWQSWRQGKGGGGGRGGAPAG